MHGCSDETEEAVPGLYPGRGEGVTLWWDGYYASISLSQAYYLCVLILPYACHTILMKQKRQLQGSSQQVGYYTTTYVLYYY
jgi:hypothetical protein